MITSCLADAFHDSLDFTARQDIRQFLAFDVLAGLAQYLLQLVRQGLRRIQMWIAHQRGDRIDLNPCLAKLIDKLTRRCAGCENIFNHDNLFARKRLQGFRVFQNITARRKRTVIAGDTLHFF